MEITHLGTRREFDEKTGHHIPVHNRGERIAGSGKCAGEEKSPESGSKEPEENPDELLGGLSEIIRDLTRRPPS